MIRSITIEDFKSYEQATLSLSPLTFLIGANASGKSNALEAIRLLSWLSKGRRLDDIARSIQGEDNLVRGQAGDLFRFDCSSLTIECGLLDMPEGWDNLRLTISLLEDNLIISDEMITKGEQADEVPLYRIDSKANPHTDEVSVLYNNFSRGRNKPHIPCSNRLAIFYQLETPSRFDKRHEKSQKLIPVVAKRVRESLRQIIFLDPRPNRMRDYAFEKNREIEEDGSNLSGVLYDICSEPDGRKELLLDFIRSLPEQDISDVRFITTERRDVMVKLVESFGGQEREVPSPLLSDGTLRVLAIAAALLSAPEGALVIIEEIDNGVHPSRAELLVKQIQSVSEKRNLRVLVTTHNPALLDSLPDNALGDVLCCYRDDETGNSRVVRLGDMDQYPELVARGTLGELVTNRTLDRYLKDKRSVDTQMQRSLQFLEEYQQELSR